MGRPWGLHFLTSLIHLQVCFRPRTAGGVLCELVHNRLPMDDALQPLLEGLLSDLGETIDPPEPAGLRRALDRGEELPLLHPIQDGVYGARRARNRRYVCKRGPYARLTVKTLFNYIFEFLIRHISSNNP